MDSEKEQSQVEVMLVRLQPLFAQSIDNAVDIFINYKSESKRTKEQFHAIKRWHGADIWLVYQDDISSNEHALVQRRINIGAYSDYSDNLLFIGDIVVTKMEGRYAIPERKVNSISITETTFNIQKTLLSNGEYAERHPFNELFVGSLTLNIFGMLRSTWDTIVQELQPIQATLLIP
jgi:hypothetical protein